jgi:Domain of unknown function (DUF397)
VKITSESARTGLSIAGCRKSTRSTPSGPMCVEVAFTHRAVAVRDSKHQDGPVLVFSPQSGAAFLAGVKNGQFDRS